MHEGAAPFCALASLPATMAWTGSLPAAAAVAAAVVAAGGASRGGPRALASAVVVEKGAVQHALQPSFHGKRRDLPHTAAGEKGTAAIWKRAMNRDRGHRDLQPMVVAEKM